jgi:hypothetical protein
LNIGRFQLEEEPYPDNKISRGQRLKTTHLRVLYKQNKMKQTNVLFSLSGGWALHAFLLLIVLLFMLMMDMNITVALPYGVTVDSISWMLSPLFGLCCVTSK